MFAEIKEKGMWERDKVIKNRKGDNKGKKEERKGGKEGGRRGKRISGNHRAKGFSAGRSWRTVLQPDPLLVLLCDSISPLAVSGLCCD